MPARRLRDAAEPIAMHAVWSPVVHEALAPLGLDFLTGYVWVAPPAWERLSLAWWWRRSQSSSPDCSAARSRPAAPPARRADLLRVRTDAAVASLERVLGAVDVSAVLGPLRRGIEAAPLVGRPLFAGLRDVDSPDAPLGQLWRACDLLREHRGDSHVAVCIREGLDPIEMNILTELWLGMPYGTYSATRGWSPDQLRAGLARLEDRGWIAGGALTEAGLAFRGAIEDATSGGQAAIVAAIGDDLRRRRGRARRLVAGLHRRRYVSGRRRQAGRRLIRLAPGRRAAGRLTAVAAMRRHGARTATTATRGRCEGTIG